MYLSSTTPSHSVLNDVVHVYMDSVQENYHEDVMRAFFRYRVTDLGRLIRRVPEITTHAAQETGRDIAELLPEANRIILVCITSFHPAFVNRPPDRPPIGTGLPRVQPRGLWYRPPNG